jgi:hypothetical protein
VESREDEKVHKRERERKSGIWSSTLKRKEGGGGGEKRERGYDISI